MFGAVIEAFRLGIAGFLVPFAFVYHPELLLKGDWPQILMMSGFAGVSAVALAPSVVGHGWIPLSIWLRGLCVIAAALMGMRTPGLQVLGLCVHLGILGLGAWRRRAVVAVSGG